MGDTYAERAAEAAQARAVQAALDQWLKARDLDMADADGAAER